MGLDMYLNKHVYVKNWSHTSPEQQYAVMVTRGGEPLSTTVLDPTKVKYIVQEVAYWRKANAIHNWFVQNVQDGNDDCGTYYVSVEQLQELLDTVNQVLAASQMVDGPVHNGTLYTPDKETGEVQVVEIVDMGQVIRDSGVAEELLPTQSGFFFGGTDYDQYYYEDLEYTRTALEAALKDTAGGEFYYHASW